jgi:hypothetical protein
MAKNDFPKPTPAESYPLGHATHNKDASDLTGFKYPSGGSGSDIGVYKQPMPNPNSTDIHFSQDPNTLRSQEISKRTGVQRVSVGDPTRPAKTEGITMRGYGAATKGIKSRGPMA